MLFDTVERFAVIGAPVLLSAMALRSARRVAVRVIAGLGLILGGLALMVFSLAYVGCSERGPDIVSPDGSHVAEQHYVLGGATSEDYANVGLRHRWNPFAELIYSGMEGPPSSPEVRWIGNSRLMIRYSDGRLFEQQPMCKDHVGGITIDCVHLAAGGSTP